MTLAAALKNVVGAASWGQTKKWIGRRCVQVNGNLCLDDARRVSEKDVIKLWQHPLAKPVEPADIRIAHLDETLVVVEKPAGVTSVRHDAERKLSTRRRQLQPTLEELLPPILAKFQRLRWPPLPPVGMNRGRMQARKRGNRGRPLPIHNAKKLPPELQVIPVHRLDRDTSGLMLFARTRAAQQRLAAMFRRHTIEREYTGVCLGEVQQQTIRSLLVRDRGDGLRGSLAEDADDAARTSSREAITHIVSAESFEVPELQTTYSLVRCKLETGRTHQIRIHLSEAGHMLCGDKVYNRRLHGRVISDSSGAPRQALHSDRLSLTHPFTGQHLQFEMALPRDLSTWLHRLRTP